LLSVLPENAQRIQKTGLRRIGNRNKNVILTGFSPTFKQRCRFSATVHSSKIYNTLEVVGSIHIDWPFSRLFSSCCDNVRGNFGGISNLSFRTTNNADSTAWCSGNAQAVRSYAAFASSCGSRRQRCGRQPGSLCPPMFLCNNIISGKKAFSKKRHQRRPQVGHPADLLLCSRADRFSFAPNVCRSRQAHRRR